MLADRRSHLIKSIARDSGFDRCGIARAESIGRADYLRAWLATGRAGTMNYLHRYLDQRTDPQKLLPGARSVIVTALSYHQTNSKPTPDAHGHRGRVAMYAWGDDYHDVIRDKLQGLVARVRENLNEPFEFKICVDTAPLLEREVAAAAGIGWIGKNTLVLHPELGSYFFLGTILTTMELTCDPPVEDHCGTCTACLDACPTSAFPAPYEMDASRCISYLTIEHRGDIDSKFHQDMGDWVFGCDVCQEVCPHNRKAPVTREPRFAIREPGPQPVLEELLQWSTDDYRTKLKGSAMKRAKLETLKRNASVAKENSIQSGSAASATFTANSKK